MRKYLRSDIVEPKFNLADRTSKLDPYADTLSRMLLVAVRELDARRLEGSAAETDGISRRLAATGRYREKRRVHV